MTDQPTQAEPEPTAALRQLALKQVAMAAKSEYDSLAVRVDEEAGEFHSSAGSKAPRNGVLSYHGRLEDNTITVVLELARTKPGGKIPPELLFHHLAGLDAKCRVTAPTAVQDGLIGLGIELQVAAVPMSFVRTSNLGYTLQKLDEVARALQDQLPRPNPADEDLTKLFGSLAEYVEPVYPLAPMKLDPKLLTWGEQVLEVLDGNTSVAIESAYPVVGLFAQALVATVAREQNRTLGMCCSASVNARSILEVLKKLPPSVLMVVPVSKIALSSNLYELHAEIGSLLGTMSGAGGAPLVFAGTQEQLGSVLSGGQGGAVDPLTPVVRHAPEVELPLLASLQSDRRHPRECIHQFRDESQRLPTTACVWNGPEGDFSPAEMNLLQAEGALPVTLGRLVLRSDTAAIYSLSVLNYELQTSA